jgi:hypothetical protein
LLCLSIGAAMNIGLRLRNLTTNAHHLLSIIVLVWIVISGPFALIDTISNLTNWKGFFLAPAHSFSAQFAHLVRDVPIASSVPAWAYSLIYLLAFLGTAVWYYWHSVALEARKLYEAAITIPLDKVEPLEEGTDALEISVAGAAVATSMVTTSMLQMATATGAVVAGPPGLVIGLAVGALLTLFGLASRSERRKEKAEAHAQQQTRRLEAVRALRAQERTKIYLHTGAKNLTVAGCIVGLIVFIEFAGPTVIQLISGRI